jgi:hypothetical protein
LRIQGFKRLLSNDFIYNYPGVNDMISEKSLDPISIFHLNPRPLDSLNPEEDGNVIGDEKTFVKNIVMK